MTLEKRSEDGPEEPLSDTGAQSKLDPASWISFRPYAEMTLALCLFLTLKGDPLCRSHLLSDRRVSSLRRVLPVLLQAKITVSYWRMSRQR